MFFGEFQHTVDEKSRLAIPVKFRKRLAPKAVVTRGLDKCLFLYPQREWEQLAKKLASLPITQANTRAFARLMLAGAMDVSLDKQGRVTLPEYLRKYARIGKKVVLAGLYSRIEIWDEGSWNKYKAETEKNSDEIAEQMDALGI